MPATDTSPTSLNGGEAKPKRKRGERLMWDEVLLTLEQHRDALSTNGAILSRRAASTGRVVFSARVRVRTVTGTKHLRLPLGTDLQVVERARRLIQQWQGERDPRRSPDPAVREMWTVTERYARSLPRALHSAASITSVPSSGIEWPCLRPTTTGIRSKMPIAENGCVRPRGRAHLTWPKSEEAPSTPDYAPKSVGQKTAAAVFQLAFGR